MGQATWHLLQLPHCMVSLSNGSSAGISSVVEFPKQDQLPCERVIKRQFLPMYPSPENSAYWRSSRGPESAKNRVGNLGSVRLSVWQVV